MLDAPHRTDDETPEGRATDASSPTGQTRRRLLGRAGAGLLTVGGAAVFLDGVDVAAAADSPARILPFLTAQECFGVTFLTEAVRRAPGTPSKKFLPVLKAANTTEFDHVRALERIGGRPLTTRFWIPDAAFDHGRVGLFEAIEKVETIEISLYLVGVTAFALKRDPFKARLCAEALGTESEHRVLARAAQVMLGKKIGAPNNTGFEAYHQRSTKAARHALEALGIGYDAKSSKPGAFYNYPGDPLANGTGTRVTSNRPA